MADGNGPDVFAPHLETHHGQLARRRSGHDVPGRRVEEPFMAGALELLFTGFVQDRAAEMGALLSEGDETVGGDPDQDARLALVRIVEDPRLAHRELVAAGDAQRRRGRLVLDDGARGERRVRKKGGTRHPHERLRELAPGDEIVVDQRNWEVVLPRRRRLHDAPMKAAMSTSTSSTVLGTMSCTLVRTVWGPNWKMLVERSRRFSAISSRVPNAS